MQGPEPLYFFHKFSCSYHAAFYGTAIPQTQLSTAHHTQLDCIYVLVKIIIIKRIIIADLTFTKKFKYTNRHEVDNLINGTSIEDVVHAVSCMNAFLQSLFKCVYNFLRINTLMLLTLSYK